MDSHAFHHSRIGESLARKKDKITPACPPVVHVSYRMCKYAFKIASIPWCPVEVKCTAHFINELMNASLYASLL